MATPVPASREEFLAYLDKSANPPEDPELDMALESATEVAEGWHNVGPIVTREFTERVKADDCGRLVLSHPPIVSITSATRIPDGLEYLTADLDVDGRSGIVTLADLSGLQAGSYTTVYEAGRGPVGDVPVSLKQAVLIIAGHIWQTQQGPTSNRFIGEEDAEDRWRPSGGYLIPNRAAHLLQPFSSVLVA